MTDAKVSIRGKTTMPNKRECRLHRDLTPINGKSPPQVALEFMVKSGFAWKFLGDAVQVDGVEYIVEQDDNQKYILINGSGLAACQE